ncbi:hypothetical protein LZG04_04555 [Saccharothrix sp. S26]|uniref:hypothetical protein n=1 Tax=Saccharothrix sp. S26 TaxID=2907215 RepID=UPI001F444DDC|nr:hypothetical protein [Saccharothrix sp. S26]MCE6994086.1 hypothetical protein [Saccharothrix sp. S26]
MGLKKAVAGFSTVVAVVGAGFATAAPALAAGTAPACIARELQGSNMVRVTNNCGRAMNVGVVIDWGPDSGCRALGIGDEMLYGWAWGTYGRVETCG